jgi:cob(I)alamin adenosyltransferase
MPPSIATRTGDDGTTQLLFGQRVPKHHPQIEAVGAFDELNAAIGLVKPQLGSATRAAEIHELLTTVQKNLVALMGELVCAESDVERYLNSKFEKLGAADVQRLDDALNALEAQGLKFSGWATPGGNARAAAFDVARTAARRAERQLGVIAEHGRTVRTEVRQFANRLSDLLWLLAREAEQVHAR